MNTFILTWNPAISEYKMDRFYRDLKVINDGETPDLYWPVEESAECADGDRFFMLRTGKGNAGICMAGYFFSDCFEDDESAGNSKHCIAGIDPLVLVNTDETDYISLDDLKQLLPHIDWDKMESGTLVDDEDAAAIENLWLRYLYKNQDIFNGYKAAKSWNFDLEDFESIPETLQEYYKATKGNLCEKCGRGEDEVGEMAYHLVLDDEDPLKESFEKKLHCYCDECWFNVEGNI